MRGETMAIKAYETWAILDTGKEVHQFHDEFHADWEKAAGTTYIKFQEPVFTE